MVSLPLSILRNLPNKGVSEWRRWARAGVYHCSHQRHSAIVWFSLEIMRWSLSVLKSAEPIPRGGEKLGKPSGLSSWSAKAIYTLSAWCPKASPAPGTSLELPMAVPLPWQQYFPFNLYFPSALWYWWLLSPGEEVEMPSLKVLELGFSQVISQDVFLSCFLQCTDKKILALFPKWPIIQPLKAIIWRHEIFQQL